MNNSFEEKLMGAAYRGLENRLVDVPSERSVAVVKAYASGYARRIQVKRKLRCVFCLAASAAACVVFFFVISQDSVLYDADPVLTNDYHTYLALTALITVIPEQDDGAFAENGLLHSDLEAEADFDAFAESLLRMQDSACLLNSERVWN